METATKKLTRIGELGQNTAEIIEDTQFTNSEHAQHSQSLIAKAGEIYRPFNSKYLGSAVVHYYADESFGGNPKFTVACQTSIRKVTEHHADFGWKQLKSALMKAFGRSEPKIKK